MADTTVLEAVTERCAGSSPVPSTNPLKINILHHHLVIIRGLVLEANVLDGAR